MSNNESEIVNYTKPAEVGYNIPAFLLIYQDDDRQKTKKKVKKTRRRK